MKSLLVKLSPLFALAGLAACASPPDYPIEPVIEFISISKDTMQRSALLADSTTVTIAFTDGDGDIGKLKSDDIFIKDDRTGSVQPLPIPVIPKLGASNGLKGEISFPIYTSCCIFPEDEGLNPCVDEYDPLPYDKIVYEVYIRDRAGHQSNTIRLQPVYIRCFNL